LGDGYDAKRNAVDEGPDFPTGEEGWREVCLNRYHGSLRAVSFHERHRRKENGQGEWRPAKLVEEGLEQHPRRACDENASLKEPKPKVTQRTGDEQPKNGESSESGRVGVVCEAPRGAGLRDGVSCHVEHAGRERLCAERCGRERAVVRGPGCVQWGCGVATLLAVLGAAGIAISTLAGVAIAVAAAAAPASATAAGAARIVVPVVSPATVFPAASRCHMCGQHASSRCCCRSSSTTSGRGCHWLLAVVVVATMLVHGPCCDGRGPKARSVFGGAVDLAAAVDEDRVEDGVEKREVHGRGENGGDDASATTSSSN
jgi:hypothetical protein